MDLHTRLATPEFDTKAAGGLLIPPPLHLRRDIQHQEIRDLEISPSDYYPEGYQSELTREWPNNTALFIPNEVMKQ